MQRSRKRLFQTCWLLELCIVHSTREIKDVSQIEFDITGRKNASRKPHTILKMKNSLYLPTLHREPGENRSWDVKSWLSQWIVVIVPVIYSHLDMILYSLQLKFMLVTYCQNLMGDVLYFCQNFFFLSRNSNALSWPKFRSPRWLAKELYSFNYSATKLNCTSRKRQYRSKGSVWWVPNLVMTALHFKKNTKMIIIFLLFQNHLFSDMRRGIKLVHFWLLLLFLVLT